MEIKLFDSELKLMELLWESEPASAKELALKAAEQIGWNKNTTYTIIKKLVDKQAVRREEPGFLCHSLVCKEEVQRAETNSLIGRVFGGSKKLLFSSLIEDESLSKDELDELKALIDRKRS